MFITDLSIRRPVVSWVFSLILIVFGIFVFWKLPVKGASFWYPASSSTSPSRL